MRRIVLALVLVVGCAGEQAEKKSTKTTVQPEGETVGGGVTPEQNDAIDAVFKRKAGQLDRCWQDEYDKNHNRQLQGDVTVGLTVSPAGKPTNVRVLKSSLGNADVEACVVREVSTWGFAEMSAECPYVRTVHLGAQF